MEEVAPGFRRIESDLGPRSLAQYLIVGEERSMLVDTGLAETADAVLAPALERPPDTEIAAGVRSHLAALA